MYYILAFIIIASASADSCYNPTNVSSTSCSPPLVELPGPINNYAIYLTDSEGVRLGLNVPVCMTYEFGLREIPYAYIYGTDIELENIAPLLLTNFGKTTISQQTPDSSYYLSSEFYHDKMGFYRYANFSDQIPIYLEIGDPQNKSHCSGFDHWSLGMWDYSMSNLYDSNLVYYNLTQVLFTLNTTVGNLVFNYLDGVYAVNAEMKGDCYQSIYNGIYKVNFCPVNKVQDDIPNHYTYSDFECLDWYQIPTPVVYIPGMVYKDGVFGICMSYNLNSHTVYDYVFDKNLNMGNYSIECTQSSCFYNNVPNYGLNVANLVKVCNREGAYRYSGNMFQTNPDVLTTYNGYSANMLGDNCLTSDSDVIRIIRDFVAETSTYYRATGITTNEPSTVVTVNDVDYNAPVIENLLTYSPCNNSDHSNCVEIRSSFQTLVQSRFDYYQARTTSASTGCYKYTSTFEFNSCQYPLAVGGIIALVTIVCFFLVLFGILTCVKYYPWGKVYYRFGKLRRHYDLPKIDRPSWLKYDKVDTDVVKTNIPPYEAGFNDHIYA